MLVQNIVKENKPFTKENLLVQHNLYMFGQSSGFVDRKKIYNE